MKTVAELEAELEEMRVGRNCTHDEYMDKVYERNGAILQEEIDKEIVDELVKIAKEILWEEEVQRNILQNKDQVK